MNFNMGVLYIMTKKYHLFVKNIQKINFSCETLNFFVNNVIIFMSRLFRILYFMSFYVEFLIECSFREI